jgi:intein/homing endonuclease
MSTNKWSNEEIEFLKDNYENYTAKELGDKIGRTKNAVALKLNRLGINVSKYNYNKHFFDTVDTEEKAYWLGFMYADGYVSYSIENRNYEASIELKASDYEHLMKFNKSLNGNVQVSYRERERWNKIHKICSIRFHSKELVEGLMKHGCLPNKTFDIKMPNINDTLIKHFIRGFFDGDGSVYHRKDRNGIYANFTSASFDFLTSLRFYLYQLGVNSYIVKDRDHHQLRIYGKDYTMTFLKHIYEESTIYLNRKYEMFDNEIASLTRNS